MNQKIADLSKYEGKAIMLTNQESQVSNKFYRSQIVEIPISMDMFHSMGSGNYYPDKGLTNTISHGAGIEFLSNIRTVDTYGDEVTHPDGTKTRKTTGKECTKQGKKMKPDGSWAPSSPDPYEFNFVDRAELDCIGKSVSDVQKRKKVLEYKKFATQRASTGASLAVIRELLGVNTSFSKEQIALGLIVVSRIEKTEEFQEVLAIAQVENIRTGGNMAENIDSNAMLLTGNTVDSQKDFNDNFENQESKEDIESKPEKPDFVNDPPPPVEKTLKEQFTTILENPEVTQEAREYFLEQVEKQDWSETILKWAIENLKG